MKMDKQIDPPNPQKYTLFSIAHQKGLSRNPGFHTHIHYELFIFHQGKCTYLIDNKFYELLPGDVIVMDGSKLHKPSILGDKDLYDRSIVQFSPEWIEPLLKFLQSDYLLDPFRENHYTIYRTNKSEQLEDLINLVMKLEHLLRLPVSIDRENELKVVLVELLFSIDKLKQYIITDAAIILDEKNVYIQQIAIYIQNNYDKKIQLEDIAKEVNISKSYLVHLFKEQTSYTIMEYLMQYRLTQVLHLMKMYPNESIKDLSNQCGFESEAHFSRFFKKNIGQSPSVFRKKLI